MQKSNNVTINADPNDQVNIKADIEPFSGDVAREYAKQAKASAENAASSESASAASESAAKDSETAAASSASAAASSAESAKESENAAASSATAAKNSETAAAASAKDAHDVAAAVGNPVTDVTEVNGKVTVTKSDGKKNEFFAGLNMLQRNKTYAVGDIAYSPNLPSWAYLECITAGTTGDTEPDLTEAGGVISDGTAQFKVVDQKEDGTDIAALKSEIDSLKNIIASIQTDISDASNFAIIYPNGGTENNPATITIDGYYELPNPFPGYYIYCLAQIKFNDKWGKTGWIKDGGSYGSVASHILPLDEIILQTGTNGIIATSRDSGNAMQTGKVVTSAPCRILVYKLGKIT